MTNPVIKKVLPLTSVCQNGGSSTYLNICFLIELLVTATSAIPPTVRYN